MAPARGGPRSSKAGISHLRPAIRHPVAEDAARARDDRAWLVRAETVAAAILRTVHLDDDGAELAQARARTAQAVHVDGRARAVAESRRIDRAKAGSRLASN